MKTATIADVGKPVSRLVLGTMIVQNREKWQLLDDACAQGCTTLDSAFVYGSEPTIGEWMKERGNREQVVIITKGAHPNQWRHKMTSFDIAADLHDSLAKLRTDYIDIYMLHRDNTDVPVGEIVEWLNEHKKAGKIRAFGGSNWRHERIQAANDYALSRGLAPFTVSSPNYSLAEQVEDPWGPGCVTIGGPKETLARGWYRATQTPVFAYSSLARGLLSGRISRENFEQQKSILDGACQKAYCHEVNFKRLDRAHQLAKQKGLTVPQIATAYILSQPLNVFALVGAANGDEWRANVEASEVSLTPEECAWLNLEAETLGVAKSSRG